MIILLNSTLVKLPYLRGKKHLSPAVSKTISTCWPRNISQLVVLKVSQIHIKNSMWLWAVGLHLGFPTEVPWCPNREIPVHISEESTVYSPVWIIWAIQVYCCDKGPHHSFFVVTFVSSLTDTSHLLKQVKLVQNLKVQVLFQCLRGQKRASFPQVVISDFE